MSGLPKQGSSTAPLPSSADVLDFICLFTHDLKRKQKRWQDGALKYHTFNRRIMVYDDRGHFIGDAHWQAESHLETGDEFELDRGAAIVQVSDFTGRREQDLTELLDKRARDVERRRANATSRTPRPNAPAPTSSPMQDQPSHFQLRHKSLSDIVGAPSRIGRAVIPPHSPYEVRQLAQRAEQDEGPPSPKRRRREESPPTKSHHARSLFGAALNLTPVATSSRAFQGRIPRDRPNTELKTLLGGRDTEQQQPKSSSDKQKSGPLQPSKYAKNSMTYSLSGTHQLLELKMPTSKALDDLAIEDASQNSHPESISVFIDERKSSKPHRAHISNTDQSKEGPIPQASLFVNKGDVPNIVEEIQRIKPTKIITENKHGKVATELLADEKEPLRPEKGPRTELRIKSRQRRGLLVISEKHAGEHSHARSSTTTIEKSVALPRNIKLENMIPATQEPDFQSRQSRSTTSGNPTKRQDETTVISITPTRSSDNTIGSEDTHIEISALSALSGDINKLPTQLPKVPENIAITEPVKPPSEKNMDKIPPTGGCKLRKRAVPYTPSDDDESDDAESLRVSKGTHKSRTADPAPLRITKMARKSVRSKEIFGFLVPSGEHALPRPPSVAPTPVTINMPEHYSENMYGNSAVSQLQKPKTQDREHSRQLSNIASVPPQAQSCVAGGNTTTKPAPRLSNPATRGKKAAKKEDAAGQVPQNIVQLDSAAMAQVGAPKLPRNETASALPGFTKANGGAWSKHAEDLLGMTRPANRSNTRR